MASKRPSSPQNSEIDEVPSKVVKICYESPYNLKDANTKDELDIRVLTIKNVNLSVIIDQVRHENEELKTKLKILEELNEYQFKIISTFNRCVKEFNAVINEALSKIVHDFGSTSSDKEENSMSLIERLLNRPNGVIETEVKQTLEELIQNIIKFVNLVQNVDRVTTTLNDDSSFKNEHETDDVGHQHHFKTEPFESIEAMVSNCKSEKSATVPFTQTNKEHDTNDSSSLHTILNSKSGVEELKKQLDVCSNKNCLITSKYLEICDRHSFVEKKLCQLEQEYEVAKFQLNTTSHRLELMIEKHRELTNSSSEAATTSVGHENDLSDKSSNGMETIGENSSQLAEIEELKTKTRFQKTEIDSLERQLSSYVQECEKLKNNRNQVTEEAVKASAVYKALESLCGIMTGEAAFQKSQVESFRKILSLCRQDRENFIDQVQTEFEKYKNVVKTDMNVLEERLEKIQEESFRLKIELESVNSCSGLAKDVEACNELRKLIDIYQKEVQILKNRLSLTSHDATDNTNLHCNEVGEIDEILDKMKENSASSEICDKIRELIKKYSSKLQSLQQEQDGIISEMEFTTQAFEEMRQQNQQLVDQLTEKETSHLKSIREKLKSDQELGLLKEEKLVLITQIETLKSHLETQKSYCKSLEEQDTHHKNTLISLEKDVTLKGQMMEIYRRKAQEAVGMYSDSHHAIEELKQQCDDMIKGSALKEEQLIEERRKVEKISEELKHVKKKEDRKKRLDFTNSSDRILMEEINMYKNKLTCPCCATNPKDAILISCFHVFCFQCLAKRYDMRQRKCPRCNMGFGHNDFRKIFL